MPQNERIGLHGQGIVQAIVLGAWITSFCWLAYGPVDDALLGRFLRSDYWWLVYTAIGIYSAFVVSLAIYPPHQHGRDRFRRSVIQAAILSLPVLYVPLAVTSELSVEAAEKRSLYTARAVVTRPESSEPTRVVQKRKGPDDNPKSDMARVKPSEPTMLDVVSDPDAFEGSDVTVIGMVYRDKKLPSDSFFCYRLLMVCCAADATPIGLIVKWPQTGEMKTGTWVKVTGKVGFTTVEGSSEPAISAVSVEKTSPPKKRFLVSQ
ncbi:MAG: TIGR03943 family protein [Desulfomonile tiedjei]|nr:TIGR03943 family protein [Desulfomonile tiedjei]